MPKASVSKFIPIEQQINGKSHTFNFLRDQATEATDKLQELLAAGETDVGSINLQLKDFIHLPASVIAKSQVPKINNPKAAIQSSTSTENKRPRGDANPKRVRALEIFKNGTTAGTSQEDMIKEVMKELSITYANAFYYYNRVFLKAKK